MRTERLQQYINKAIVRQAHEQKLRDIWEGRIVKLKQEHIKPSDVRRDGVIRK